MERRTDKSPRRSQPRIGEVTRGAEVAMAGDLGAVLAKYGGKTDELQRIVRALAEEPEALLGTIATIADAAAQADLEALKRSAQTLKKSIRIFQDASTEVRTAHELALRLEEMGPEGKVLGPVELVPKLEPELAYLNQLLAVSLQILGDYWGS